MKEFQSQGKLLSKTIYFYQKKKKKNYNWITFFKSKNLINKFFLKNIILIRNLKKK
jgi:hypothetical protein